MGLGVLGLVVVFFFFLEHLMSGFPHLLMSYHSVFFHLCCFSDFPDGSHIKYFPFCFLWICLHFVCLLHFLCLIFVVSTKNGVVGKLPKSAYSQEEQTEPKLTFLLSPFPFYVFLLLFCKLDLEGTPACQQFSHE